MLPNKHIVSTWDWSGGCGGPEESYALVVEDGFLKTRLIFNNGISCRENTNCPVNVPLNQWTFLVGTYNGATIKLYIDGVLQDSKSATGAIQRSTTSLHIGTSPPFGTNTYFEGLIDDVRLYSRALSPAEILVLFNGMPVLGNNQLTINEGQTVILTPSILSATDADSDDASLLFTVTNVQNGQFERVSNPLEPITTFTQQEIIEGDIQFVHDGSETAPSYSVKVSDGSFESEFYSGNIDFHLSTPDVTGDKPTNFLPYAIGGGVAAGIVACAATSITAAISVGFFCKKACPEQKNYTQ